MHKDLGRVHVSAMNIIPTSTGAAISLPRIEHGLTKGCMNGLSLCASSATGVSSLVDVSINTRDKITKEQFNETLKTATESGHLKGIMKYSEDQNVSSEVIENPI